jgi:hypothetical protein
MTDFPYKLGKLPAEPDRIKFKFSRYFWLRELPKPPKVFGHRMRTDWGMCYNDQLGCCVVSGAAHETMLWTREWNDRTGATFSDADIIRGYNEIGGYQPGNPSTDRGCSMATAASYRRNSGIADAAGVTHKIAAYVAFEPGNLGQIETAAFLFGAIGIGLELPDSAMKQFSASLPWEISAGARTIGGHYVPLIGRNSLGYFLVITWGRLHAVAPTFLQQYMDEGLAYVSPESLGPDGKSLEGFDVEALNADLNALTNA